MRALILATCLVCTASFAADKAAIGAKGPSQQAVAAAPGLQIVPQLQDIKGVVSWEILARVDFKTTKDRIIPTFAKEVLALNGQQVQLQGFMMPLDPGKSQKHFLISVNSATCPYCMPAGPEGVVEVKSSAPIKYGFEPIVISGKLSVLGNDPTGLFYKMSNAVLSSAN